MKLLSAYETDLARVYVVERKPAISSALNVAAEPAIVDEVHWGLDVPESVSYRETVLLYQQRTAAEVPPTIRRRLAHREGNL